MKKGPGSFFYAIGGRKNLNGIIGTVLVVAYAIYVQASFLEFAGAIIALLTGTNIAIATEDVRKSSSIEVSRHVPKG